MFFDPSRRSLLKAFAALSAFMSAPTRAISAAWQHLARLPTPTGALQFGRSVAVAGNVGLVGSSQRADLFLRPPAGSILPPHLWLHAKQFVPQPGATGLFGSAVAIDGNRLAIGAPFGDPQLVNNGYVDIYELVASTWTFTQKVVPTPFDTPPPQWPELLFGQPVLLRGDTLVVGAQHFYDTAGRVFVFERNGGSFVQTQQLKPAVDVKETAFGRAISISGDSMAIGRGGAGGAGGPPQEPLVPGEVHVYTRSGGPWSLQQVLVASDGAPGDRFGEGLDLQGGQLAVRSTTKVYLFARSGGVWSQVWQAALPPSSWQGDVVLRPAGTRGVEPDLFVGEPYWGSGGQTDVGRVLRFKGAVDGPGFVASAPLLDPSPAAGAKFGSALSGSGGLLLVGGPSGVSGVSRARVFERQPVRL